MADSPRDTEAGLSRSGQPVEDQDQHTRQVSSEAPKSEQTPDHRNRAKVALEHIFHPDFQPKEGAEHVYKYSAAPEARSDLEIFQNLVGIHFLRVGGGMLHRSHQKDLGNVKPVPPLTDIFFPATAASAKFRNRGLYARCLSQDQRARVMYGLSNYVISSLYLLQILIAAAITGLSAYEREGNVPLTVLGAINTVLAGILAWLNGQGMPTRFRRARDQYKEVVKAIETAERTFAEIDYVQWPGGSRPNPFKERDKLEKMYEEARSDQESNYPDSQEGPSKNQMEGTKRVLEEQIRGHVDEKNKHAEKLQEAEQNHTKKLTEKTKLMENELKAERERITAVMGKERDTYLAQYEELMESTLEDEDGKRELTQQLETMRHQLHRTKEEAEYFKKRAETNGKDS